MIRNFLRECSLRFPELYDLLPSGGIDVHSIKEPTMLEGTVFGPNAVLQCLGQMRPEMCASHVMLRALTLRNFLPRKIQCKITIPCFYAGGLCSDNHWHQVVDIIPAILKYAGDLPIVVGPNFKAYDVFKFFGIDKDRFIPIRTPTFFTQLLVAPVTHIPLQERVDLLCRKAPMLRRSWHKRIYISRADAYRRGILNEDEVWHFLMQNGFSRIVMSAYPFEQQLKYIAGADTIVMAHGAAGANLFAGWLNTKVIELMPTVGWGSSTMQMCKALELDYTLIECRNWFGRMRVDINELAKHI